MDREITEMTEEVKRLKARLEEKEPETSERVYELAAASGENEDARFPGKSIPRFFTMN